MKKFWIAGLICFVAVVWGVSIYGSVKKANNEVIGLRLVDAMYNFTATELKAQDAKLKEILSDALYNSYSLSVDQRQLHAYLKFKNRNAKPVVVLSEMNRVVYWIDSPEIEEFRTFQVEYKVSGGKVVAIAESELFYLVPSDRGFYND